MNIFSRSLVFFNYSRGDIIAEKIIRLDQENPCYWNFILYPLRGCLLCNYPFFYHNFSSTRLCFDNILAVRTLLLKY